MKSKIKKIVFGFAPIALVALGLIIALVMINLKPDVPTTRPERKPALVEVLEAKKETYHPIVIDYGYARASSETILSAKVDGVVESISKSFDSGGFFERGAILFTIDQTDYIAALQEAQARLASAELALARERAEAKVARIEIESIKDKKSISKLATRDIQLNAASVEFKSAQEALTRAQSNLAATRVSAPFAGRTLERNIGLGQYLQRGANAGSIYSTGEFELTFSVKLDDLRMLGLTLDYLYDKNDPKRSSKPIKARLTAQGDGSEEPPEWSATIIRTGGAIDSQTRLVDLIARIDSDQPGATKNRPAIAPGLFLKGEIHGPEYKNIVILPDTAMREGGKVYLLKDGLIQPRQVETLQRFNGQVALKKGVEEGDLVIVSFIDSAYEGAPAILLERDKDKP